MIETMQFVKWMGRHLLAFFGAIPMACYNSCRFIGNKFNNELRTNTFSALALWVLFTILAELVIVFSLRIVAWTDGAMFIKLVGLTTSITLGVSVIILVVLGTRALYETFKEDQKRVIDELKRNFNNEGS